MSQGVHKPLGAQTASQISPAQESAAQRERREIREAGDAMEGVFLETLLQTMRESVPESEFGLNNQGTRIYQSMLDSEYAKIAAKTHNFGLSDQIVAYLESARYPENSTGGTHESSAQSDHGRVRQHSDGK